MLSVYLFDHITVVRKLFVVKFVIIFMNIMIVNVTVTLINLPFFVFILLLISAYFEPSLT